MKQFTLFGAAIAIAIASILCTAVFAQPPVTSEPTLYDPQVDVRNGGVIEESYDYHQEGHAYQSGRPGPYPPKGGWYGYGFPVSSYRWGWFGAEHYYPRVGWHTDYNGDCVRFAYRYGY